jgi:hypothetical protein
VVSHLTTCSTYFTPLKTDTSPTKRKMMPQTDVSRMSAMTTLLPLTRTSLNQRESQPNFRTNLKKLPPSETKRSDKELPRISKEVNSKKSLMTPPTKELKKPTVSKRREKNSNSSHQSLLKPEDSSQITSRPHHSSKPVRTKPSTSLLKLWPKSEAIFHPVPPRSTR